MQIINIKDNEAYLREYIKLCSLEWGNKKVDEEYINNKIRRRAKDDNKVISILGLIDNNILIGFISLFSYDGDEKKELCPWYATMYVKKEYRKNGYSKILNDVIIKEAKDLGYKKIYLKTNLVNYYEKFGFIYIDDLKNKEKLYYKDI